MKAIKVLGWEGGKELRGAEGEETRIRIYYM